MVVGKWVAAAFAGAMVVGSSAFAADVYERGGGYKDTPVYESGPNWAGFFIGGHVGAAWNDITLELEGVGSETLEGDAELIGGGHVGYNWQWGQKVIGFEGDFDGVDIEGVDYLASARLKLGFASGPTLFYVTGGVAFLGLDADKTPTFEDSQIGWVVGGGVDYQFKPGWSLGVEALYYNFDDNDASITLIEDRRREASREDEFLVVRGRLTYHFGQTEAEPLK